MSFPKILGENLQALAGDGNRPLGPRHGRLMKKKKKKKKKKN
jgi:hypothetical protein